MGANVIMNSQQELAEASADLRAGYFGPSWEPTEGRRGVDQSYFIGEIEGEFNENQ